MKTIAVITATLLLSGCFYQTVNQHDIQRAIVACGSLENIVEIYAEFIGDESVTCSNGFYGLSKIRYKVGAK